MLKRIMVLSVTSVFVNLAIANEPIQTQTVPPKLNSDDLTYLKQQTQKSLKTVAVPEPVNLNEFVKDKEAAIRLGKALFWDVQVGSDGVTACGTCHSHAFGDGRVKNSVSPTTLPFTVPGPNGIVTAGHFPITSFATPDQPGAELNPQNPFVHSSGDRISSAGVRNFDFVGLLRNKPYERARAVADTIFNVNRENVRRVEPRNTPTVINTVFNFNNFWDGRARNIFNGVNPFGELDEKAKVFVKDRKSLKAVQVRIPDASLASVAVGPPLSDFEMSSRNRTFPVIGKKLLDATPLKFQRVHPQDSSLGRLADRDRGLRTKYERMIREAFVDKWWNDRDHKIKFISDPKRIHHPDSSDPRTFALDAGTPIILKRDKNQTQLADDEFSQMEANFSLFFGLAVQLYEATLVSDDTKWDRVQEGTATFTEDEQKGQEAFTQACAFCHVPPEFTAHSTRLVRNGQPAVPPGYIPSNPFGVRKTGTRETALADAGTLNLGVRPGGSLTPGAPGFVANTEDIGHGGFTPIINPVTGKPYPMATVRLSILKKQNLLPPDVAMFVPDLPPGPEVQPGFLELADGAFKAPSLRNAELLGPYFHTGDAATLEQAVEFYTRGGNFPVTNSFNRDSGVRPIEILAGNPTLRKQVVKFLLTLTDERVRLEKAPFDHPEITVPAGSPGNNKELACKQRPPQDLNTSYCDEMITVPAVGANGRTAEGLPPLGTFLNLDPTTP